MTGAPQTRPNPYVGPRAFQYGETLYGRDREVMDLLDLLIAERIVLLYSPSGAGKTSLIQAALIPKLEQEGFQILPVMRVSLEPPTVGQVGNSSNRYVLSLLLSLEEPLPAGQQTPLAELAGMELEDYLDRRPAPADEVEAEVLIFDQFEEILTVEPTNQQAKAAFFAQVGATLRDRRRWALFAMREEYLAGLDPYLRPLPTRLSTTYRLELLGKEAALDAIEKPARQAGVDFTDAAASKLVDDLRQMWVPGPDGTPEERLGLYVEPVQLQVVCRRLWKKLPTDATQIVEADVEAVGDVDSALAGYYAEQVAAIAGETGVRERTIREWFDRHLITKQGIRGQVLQGPDRSEGLDNRAIWPLVDAHLVRAEKRRGATWFELAHDRLIEPVRAHNAEWREAHLSALQRQAALWKSQGRPGRLLLRDQALVEAEKWAAGHDDELTDVERDFLEECRETRAIAERERQSQRNRRLATIATVISAVVILAFLVSLKFFFQAREEAKIAEARRLEAVTAQAQAKDEAERARQAEATAEALRLADAAIDNLEDGDPDLGLLLAVQAVRRTYDSADSRILIEAEAALHQSLQGTEQIKRMLLSHTDEIVSLAFSPDGRYLSTASHDGTAVVWDATSGDELLLGHSDQVLDLAFGPDPNRTLLATASADGTARVWLIESSSAGDVASGQQLLTLAGHAGPVFRIIFSPDGTRLATASTDETSKVWDATSGQELLTLAGHSGGIRDLAFSPNPDNILLASAGADGKIKAWDVASGQELLTLAGHTDSVLRLTFSPDGTRLATASADGTARVWLIESSSAGDVASGQQLLTLAGHAGPVRDVAFSPGPDSACLATASEDETAKVWDAVSGEELFTLTDHKNSVTRVAFSPDGTRLATASLDTTAKVWSLDVAGRPVTFADHTKGVTGVVFSPDGRRLATASSDSTARLYTLDIETLLELACNQATRNLAQDEWETYTRKDVPYQRTCPGLPVHPTAILEYVRQGQIEKARESAPEAELAQALFDLGKELASQEGKSREALRALNQAVEFDPQLELDQTAALAGAYNQVCALGSADHLPRAVSTACERAVALAIQTDDVSLNNEICQNGRLEKLLGVVLPACERAVALAVQTEDASLNASVCQNGEKVEALADIVEPACERGAVLSKTGELVIEFVPSPNYNERPDPNDITTIVVHATANNTLVGSVSWFQNPSAYASAHYVIGKDGKIVQMVEDELRAWHTGKSEWKGVQDVNDFSIGIQLVNLNDGQDPYPEAQYQVLVALCKELVARHDIKVEDIIGHKDISSRKTDPAGLDLDQLRRDVEIEQALALAPEADVAKGLFDLGQELVSQGEYDEALAALNQAVELDPQFERDQLVSLAEVYSQVCALGNPNDFDTISACERAVTLAVQTDNVSLNNQICQNCRTEELTDTVLPACKRAVDLAIKTDDYGVNAHLCWYGDIESLADIVLPACERAAELSGLPVEKLEPSDGFDFPVGKPDAKGYFVASGLAEQEFYERFKVWLPGEHWNGIGGGDSDLGDPVYAISRGRVVEFGYYVSWGNIVLLEHILTDGTHVWSKYAHLDQMMVEEVGQIVERGQQIGTIGKGDGNRYPAHLYFEIRRNELPIDAWEPFVHSKEQVLANFYHPTEFIKEHRPSGLQTPAPSAMPTTSPTPTPTSYVREKF